MPEDAAVDAGLDTDQSVVDSGDTGIQEGIETDASNTQPEETTAPKDGIQQAPYRAVSEDGKRLDEKARATIDEIRAKDPALAKEIRNALFEVDRFKREVPGGLTEVRELRQAIETLGGEPGIRETQEKLAGWDSFDNQYMAGDPKALEFMLSTPESQQAFLKLAPMAMNKFEELNPDGFAAYVCQRIIGDALHNRIPISLELAQHFLAAGDQAKAAEEFGKVVAWFQGLDATSKKAVAPPQTKGPDAKTDPRYQELEQENARMLRDGWKTESAAIHNQIYSRELGRLLDGRKVTDSQREDILLYVKTKLEIRARADEEKINRYFSAKDKDGYLKMAKTFGEKNITDLLREAVNRYVPQKPGPRPGTTQTNQNGAPLRPPMNGKPEAGFAVVQKAPASSEIDWSNPFNSNMNIKNGKAVLIGGRKVSWR